MASGAGSRGGKVIGRTKSGKPVYEAARADAYSGFSAQDHVDASVLHSQKRKQHEGEAGKHAKGTPDTMQHTQKAKSHESLQSQHWHTSRNMKQQDMGKSEGFYIRSGQAVTPATLDNLRTMRQATDTTGLRGPQPVPGVGPRLSIASITRDIGMDASTQMVWRDYLSTLMDEATDEYSMRSDLYDHMREASIDPYLSKAIVDRAVQYWRQSRARKSLQAQDTLRKSAAPVRACYEAVKSYLTTAGADGVPYDGLDPYEQCYGPGIMAEVMGVLDDTGAMTFDGDRFYSTATPQFVASL